MTCSELHPEIALLVGGELPPERRPALERHLESCGSCRRLAVALREDRRALGALADEPVDRDALERIRGRVSAAIAAERPERQRRAAARRRSRAFLALAAALGALALGLAVWLSGLRGRPDTPRPTEVTAHNSTEGGTEPSARGTAGEPGTSADSASGDRTGHGTGDRSAERTLGAHPAPVPTDHTPDRIATAGPAPTRTTPIGPTAAATDDQVAAKGHGPDNPSITIRIVSDEPDIVFYWLVDEPKEVPDDAAG